MLKKIRRAFSIGLLLFGSGLLVWASLPSKHEVVVQAISSSEMQLPSNGQANIPSILETRQVRLDWPSSMRIGDMEGITLVFEPIANDMSASNPQDKFSDIYKDYNIMAEARFEVAGIRVSPAIPTRESMLSGRPVKYEWQINAEQARTIYGTVWLSLRFLALDGNMAIQKPIFIREVDIHATSLCGMSAPMARLLGSTGIILSVVIIFDDMISWFRKRRTRTDLTTDKHR